MYGKNFSNPTYASVSGKNNIVFVIHNLFHMEELSHIAESSRLERPLCILYGESNADTTSLGNTRCISSGYCFNSLQSLPPPYPPCYGHPHEMASLRIHQALRDAPPAILYFEGALGFHCLQARRVLGEYPETIFLMRPSPLSNPDMSPLPLRATRESFSLRYCAEHSDVLLADAPDGTAEQFLKDASHLSNKIFTPSEGWKAVLENRIPPPSSYCKTHPLPTLSVCMAHYNHARYLPWALDSLEQQTYPDFEVIVTDDGSTDAEARKIFAEEERRRDARFRFFRKENSGPGETRNFCAAQATGDCLVFMDADNLAAPGMLRTFAEAMARTQVDALTCHFEAFPADYIGLMPPRRLYRSAPTGQDLVTGLLENMFGDTNMAVRSSVFRALGGMHPTRTGVEDWEFLARLGLTGHTQDVIPETLFYYRLTPEGISRNNAHMNTLECIYGTYKRYGLHEDLAQKLIERFLLPYHKLAMDGNLLVTESVFLRQAVRIGLFLEKLYQNLCPTGSKRQRFFTTCRHFHQKVFPNKTPSPSSFS